jgi:hypothetical protein
VWLSRSSAFDPRISSIQRIDASQLSNEARAVSELSRNRIVRARGQTNVNFLQSLHGAVWQDAINETDANS